MLITFLFLSVLLPFSASDAYFYTHGIYYKHRPNITDAHRQAIKECSKLHENYNILLDYIDGTNPSHRHMVKVSCQNLELCLMINFAYSESKPFLDPVRAYCSILKFVDHGPCYHLLEAKNSKCFQNWKPLNSTALNTGFTRSQSCQLSFGPDNCIKEEMTNVCGRMSWEHYRNPFYNLGNGTATWSDCERLDVIKKLLKTLVFVGTQEKNAGNYDGDDARWADGGFQEEDM